MELDQAIKAFQSLTPHEKKEFREVISCADSSLDELECHYWTQLRKNTAYLLFGIDGLMPTQIVEQIENVSAEAYPHLRELLYDTAHRLEAEFIRLRASGKVPVFDDRYCSFELPH